jgi:hypothetical protein
MSYTPRERKRPTSTVIVPAHQLGVIIAALVEERHTFTVEPASIMGVWHVGILPESGPILTALFGPMTNVGTLGDYL